MNGVMPVTTTPLTWNSGSPQSNVSRLLRSTIAHDDHASASSLKCVWRATFGRPVVPPVWKHDATSSRRMRRPLTSRSEGWRSSSAAKGNKSSASACCSPTTSTVRRLGTRFRMASTFCHSDAPSVGPRVTSTFVSTALRMCAMWSGSSNGFTAFTIPAASPPQIV